MEDVEIRIAVLEHLVKAMLKDSTLNGTFIHQIKGSVRASLLGSDGLGGPEQKSKACEYLDRLI
ncbi:MULTISPECIES: hypothetical protein [unclassified Pseudomonas]|uniref:hypothetical protein n=1 Tax=unclassified Pseudomonas TaxID=196821 RepID=UPI0023B90B4F|nr:MULTISPECIES: hypothetical protein [unclassified Pseudomonas]